MAELKGVGGRRTQVLDDLRNRRRYLDLKDEAEDRKGGNDSLSHEHKEKIQLIFHKSMNLLKGSIFNNKTPNDTFCQFETAY